MKRFLGFLLLFTALLFGIFSTAETNDTKSFATHVGFCLVLLCVGLLLLFMPSRPRASHIASRPMMREFPVERVELHPGFTVEARLPSDPASRGKLAQRWAEMRNELAQEACQLYANYTEGERIDEGKIWETMREVVLRTGDSGIFELSCSFTWQDPADSHVITFYFEDWKLVEHTVDG